MKIEREIEIGAPPERVYGVVMDPKRLGEWVTIHESLEQAPDGELGKGSELTQCLKLAGRKFNVRWTVVEDDRPSRVVWQGKGPVRSRASVIYELERNGRETSFSYTNEFKLPGGLLGAIGARATRRFTARELDRSLERLKALIEGGR
jgi:carbon monoxide dehydrogenase subunit G